jgi:tripartite-type tricarboxylate transporter receptor subunit TctC
MEGFDYPACVTSWGPGSTKCNRSQENAMRTPLLLTLLGLLSLHPMSAVAQSEKPERYPERPVRVIVPYVAGAAADVIGRIVSQKLSEHTGTQFYVENLPGAESGFCCAAIGQVDGPL